MRADVCFGSRRYWHVRATSAIHPIATEQWTSLCGEPRFHYDAHHDTSDGAPWSRMDLADLRACIERGETVELRQRSYAAPVGPTKSNGRL
jgi:hypothetical protein